MRKKSELQRDRRLTIHGTGSDGGYGVVKYGTLRVTVIWSDGGGWEHVSVNPFKKDYTPTWEDMCLLKEIFFKDDEIVVQIHPAKDQYVNNLEHCLHLWRCTCAKQPVPPSIMVGVRGDQTLSDAAKELSVLNRAVDAQIEKLRMIDEYLKEEHIHPKWREMILEYRQMIADGKGGKEAAQG